MQPARRVLIPALICLSLAAVPDPAQGQTAADPDLVQAAQAVDEAWSRIDTKPLTATDLQTTERLLKQADRVLGTAIGRDQPAPWARARQIDTLLLIELFNRFNEVSTILADAQRLQGSVVWATDAETLHYLDRKQQGLKAAKAMLSADRFRLYLAAGHVGDRPEDVTKPWTTYSGPRYGFDVGRFRWRITLDLDDTGRTTVNQTPESYAASN